MMSHEAAAVAEWILAGRSVECVQNIVRYVNEHSADYCADDRYLIIEAAKAARGW